MMRRKTDPKTRKHTLCEAAQSKCTWTCHRRHFARWKKSVHASRGEHLARGCAVEMRIKFYTENGKGNGYHLDGTPGLKSYGKNPFSMVTLFGEPQKKPDCADQISFKKCCTAVLFTPTAGVWVWNPLKGPEIVSEARRSSIGTPVWKLDGTSGVHNE